MKENKNRPKKRKRKREKTLLFVRGLIIDFEEATKENIFCGLILAQGPVQFPFFLLLFFPFHYFYFISLGTSNYKSHRRHSNKQKSCDVLLVILKLKGKK